MFSIPILLSYLLHYNTRLLIFSGMHCSGGSGSRLRRGLLVALRKLIALLGSLLLGAGGGVAVLGEHYMRPWVVVL